MLKFLSLFLFILFFSQANSQQLTPQNINLKFSIKYQITQNNFLEVPDNPNHRIGTASGTGIALFNDSISVTVNSYFIYDYTEGNGQFTDYYVFTFENGSSFTVQAQGTSQGSGPNASNPLFQASTIITAGTGDFLNFMASGVMSGNRNTMVENNAVVKLSFDMKSSN